MMVMVTGTVTVMTMVMMTLMVTVMVRKLQMVLITIVARQPVPGDEFYCGCIMQSPDQHLLRIALHYMYDLTESIPPPAASPAAQQRLVL